LARFGTNLVVFISIVSYVLNNGKITAEEVKPSFITGFVYIHTYTHIYVRTYVHACIHTYVVGQ